HTVPARRADDRPSLRGRRAAAGGAAPAGGARQHRRRDRAQPRRAEDRGLGDRPRARGRREGWLRDRRGHARTADGEPRFGDRPVPARTAGESREGQKVRGLGERRPALAARARRRRRINPTKSESSPALLLAICVAASLTGPLSAAGARSIFPTLVPGHLWERANALDSSSHVLASVIGAPLAGVLVAFTGPEWALAATASLFALAGVA